MSEHVHKIRRLTCGAKALKDSRTWSSRSDMASGVIFLQLGIMKGKSNRQTQVPKSWHYEKVKAYYVYEKKTGKVWLVSTDKETRDEDYKELRQEYPKAKLGKITKVVMRKDLLKAINQNRVD